MYNEMCFLVFIIGAETGATCTTGLGDDRGRVAYFNGRRRPEHHAIHGGVERDSERQRQGNASAGASWRSTKE